MGSVYYRLVFKTLHGVRWSVVIHSADVISIDIINECVWLMCCEVISNGHC